MAAPPSKLTLSQDEIPDAPAWFIEKYLQQASLFSQGTSRALEQGLTFSENFKCEVKTVQLVGPKPVWRAGVFSGTWANSPSPNPACAYRIDWDGVVRTKGVANTGTANTTIITVPAGYRPLERVPLITAANGAAVLCAVETTGTILTTGAGAGAVQLDGLSWLATSPAAPERPTAPWPYTVQHGLDTVAWVVPMRTISSSLSSSSLVGVPVFDWAPATDGSVVLRDVRGLVAGQKYQVDLLLVAG